MTDLPQESFDLGIFESEKKNLLLQLEQILSTPFFRAHETDCYLPIAELCERLLHGVARASAP